jgi:hypothetical protein
MERDGLGRPRCWRCCFGTLHAVRHPDFPDPDWRGDRTGGDVWRFRPPRGKTAHRTNSILPHQLVCGAHSSPRAHAGRPASYLRPDYRSYVAPNSYKCSGLVLGRIQRRRKTTGPQRLAGLSILEARERGRRSLGRPIFRLRSSQEQTGIAEEPHGGQGASPSAPLSGQGKRTSGRSAYAFRSSFGSPGQHDCRGIGTTHKILGPDSFGEASTRIGSIPLSTQAPSASADSNRASCQATSVQDKRGRWGIDHWPDRSRHGLADSHKWVGER